MTIERATINSLDLLFTILNECRTALMRDGIFQWTAHYPTPDTVENDIRSGHLYCFVQDGSPVGMITLNEIQDEEYKQVQWSITEGKTMVIHRLAVHPQYQKNGIARRLMDFAEQLAADHGFSSIRLDAFTGNKRSLQFYENRGYEKRGEVFFPGRALPFYCYEKRIGMGLE